MSPRVLLLALVGAVLASCGVPKRHDPANGANETNNASETGSSARTRWALPDVSPVAFRPICADFDAPSLGDPIATQGMVPVYLFGVDGASDEDQAKLREGLIANGFAVGDGSVTINQTKVVFAVGQGLIKTQAMADRLYQAMCGLDQGNIHLVHARYNDPSEPNRMM